MKGWLICLVGRYAQDGCLCLFDRASSELIVRCEDFPQLDVSSIVFHPQECNRMFASCGMEVLEFDVRSLPCTFSDAEVSRYSILSCAQKDTTKPDE